MKLKEFIEDLTNILTSVDNLEKTEVKMADYIPVVKPVYRDKTVFITDVDEATPAE